MTKPIVMPIAKEEMAGIGRLRFWMTIAVVVVAVAWILLAQFLAPSLIEKAYQGQGNSILSRIILEAGEPLEGLQRGWGQVTQAGIVACAGFWLIAFLLTSSAFSRRFVGEATAGSLGAIRMLTCAILLTSTIWEDLASSALLPREMIRPSGIIRLLFLLPIGFDKFAGNATALRIFEWITAGSLFLAMIGWRTRIFVPLAAVCYLLMAGIFRQYAWFYHTGLVPIYVIGVLSFTPCGDGWSLDRLSKIMKGQLVEPADRNAAVYGWSRFACWVAIALPYVAAGMSKIRNGGLFWWTATNMRAILYQDALNPMQFDWDFALSLRSAPDIVFSALGLTAVLGELTFGFVLFSRMARLVLPMLMVLMHLGIVLLQNVLFFDLMFLQLAFYDFTSIRKRVGDWLGLKRGLIQVLYDGSCPFCTRVSRMFSCLDLFHRLQWIDFRRTDLAEFNRVHTLDIRASDLEGEMCVVTQKDAYSGFYGYRVLALALPIFWLIAPLLFLPGAGPLGRVIYRFIAERRLSLIRCDATCAVHEESGMGPEPGAPPSASLKDFMAPLAVSGLMLLLLLCWLYRIEHYPFTAMQMYTRPRTDKIAYYKVLGERESGEQFRAKPETVIRAMADGRYRKVIAMCFDPEKVHICRRFFETCAAAYNKVAKPDEKVTRFEVQKWSWDFRSNPLDPDYGELMERYQQEVR